MYLGKEGRRSSLEDVLSRSVVAILSATYVTSLFSSYSCSSVRVRVITIKQVASKRDVVFNVIKV